MPAIPASRNRGRIVKVQGQPGLRSETLTSKMNKQLPPMTKIPEHLT